MDALKLLFVDDEEDFRAPISDILRSQEINVSEVGSGKEMDAWLAGNTPDLILLDVNLPGESGFDIAQRLKQNSNVSIIMLTAYGSVENRIEGLTRGADYYLPKPVDIRELLAVINNLTARSAAEPTAWTLNTTAWSLTTPDGVRHDLNKSELLILSELARTPGEPVSKSDLYTAIGMPDYSPDSRTLEVQISRLRKRFTTEDYSIPLKTLHSIGYLFNDDVHIVD